MYTLLGYVLSLEGNKAVVLFPETNLNKDIYEVTIPAGMSARLSCNEVYTFVIEILDGGFKVCVKNILHHSSITSEKYFVALLPHGKVLCSDGYIRKIYDHTELSGELYADLINYISKGVSDIKVYVTPKYVYALRESAGCEFESVKKFEDTISSYYAYKNMVIKNVKDIM